MAKFRRDYCGDTFRSTWEVVLAASLRKGRVEFVYEPVIDLGKLGGYRPDFFIPSLGLYLEVKGRSAGTNYERQVRKFRQFAQTHNALLLDKHTIKALVGTRNPASLTNWQIAARVLPFTDFLKLRLGG